MRIGYVIGYALALPLSPIYFVWGFMVGCIKS